MYGARPDARALARNSGFTLLEVFVAASLLSVVAFSAMLTVVPVGRQIRINEGLQSVVAQMQNIIEQVNVVPFHEVLEVYPEGTVIPLQDVEQGTVAISYEDLAADPLQVRFTADWTTPDLGPMQRIFSTVRTE